VGREAATAYATGTNEEDALRLYDGITGLAAFPGNALAGLFWVIGGPGLAFGYAGWALGLGLALLLAWLPWLRRGFT
jgi:hypothetical protein